MHQREKKNFSAETVCIMLFSALQTPSPHGATAVSSNSHTWHFCILVQTVVDFGSKIAKKRDKESIARGTSLPRRHTQRYSPYGFRCGDSTTQSRTRMLKAVAQIRSNLDCVTCVWRWCNCCTTALTPLLSAMSVDVHAALLFVRNQHVKDSLEIQCPSYKRYTPTRDLVCATICVMDRLPHSIVEHNRVLSKPRENDLPA